MTQESIAKRLIDAARTAYMSVHLYEYDKLQAIKTFKQMALEVEEDYEEV